MSKRPTEKKEVRVTLHKFYKITRTHILTGEEELIDEVPPDYYDHKDFDYCNESEEGFGQGDFDLEKLTQAYLNIPDKHLYLQIKFYVNCSDGYSHSPSIIGFRLETDEEFSERIKLYDSRIAINAANLEAKRLRVLENKKKKLEKLKKELGEE